MTTETGKFTLKFCLYQVTSGSYWHMHIFFLLIAQCICEWEQCYNVNQFVQGDKSSVLDIGADESQTESENLCFKLCSELGCPVVLSLNFQVPLYKKDQKGLIKLLTEKFTTINPK